MWKEKMTPEERRKWYDHLNAILHINDYQDFVEFVEIDHRQMKDLLDQGLIDPDYEEGDIPTTREFYKFCRNHPFFSMRGYLVAGNREDARLVVWGVAFHAPLKFYEMTPSDITDFVGMFRQADHFLLDVSENRAEAQF